MKSVTYAEAQDSLLSVIDTVCDFDEEVIITTKNDKTVVMVSLDEYNRTHHRLKRDILRAKREIEDGEFMGIDEAFQRAKQAYRA